MTAFHEILENYRTDSSSTHEQGTRFEVLMKNFLLTYAPYRGKFSEVWLWKDFPFRADFGGKDLGIDIVAKTVDKKFWAVQCKFYSETSTIDKSAVDSFFSNATRNFDGDKKFSAFVWICTTDNYTDNAREMFKGRAEQIHILGIEDLRKAEVDWQKLDAGNFGDDAIPPRQLRDYQIDAINAADEHFQKFNRGQLIMACGTGKTFTALKIAEKISPDGKILFLVPSISLLSQTLLEWAGYAEKPVNAVCVCSDATATKNIDDEIVEVNLPLPAITDEYKIAAAVKNFSDDNLTVIFSTYQSIDKVQAAQQIFDSDFDLIICDEAHRTTGLSDKSDKTFTKVHDENFIRGKKRLYMTATPRFYKTDSLKGDDEKSLTVWSMNDKNIFGKEFYRISFAKAVNDGWLSDYKVFVFTVNELFLTQKLRDAINDKNNPLTMDETLKLIGVIIALSKHMDKNSFNLIKDDENKFMHSAVSFCKDIDDVIKIHKFFPEVQEKFLADMSDDDKKFFVQVKSDFVYGSRKIGKKPKTPISDEYPKKISASQREYKLQLLKNSDDENICRILNNVRCLSEGVDVPALDAVIFLSSRKSKVEVIQAVGRVMRKAEGKKFGYIIIPVIVPLDKPPEIFLQNDKDFSVVFEVLNALRAHDDAMNIEIERIRNTGKSEKIVIGGGIPPFDTKFEKSAQIPLALLLRWDDVKNKLYARIVENLGNKLYWIQWAEKVKSIVERHTQRIKEIISVKGPARSAFIEFQCGLQKNLNPSVTENEIVDMLAQHLVTKPIFDAIFKDNSFAQNNPVSIAMQNILDELDKDGMSKDYEIFSDLYKQVAAQCDVTDDPKQRQEIIIRLYDSFFRLALPTTAQKLGIVYTPVEVVDFILNSVNDVLQKNFGKTFSDKNIHILDGFTGTGTFITRLLESGLIDKKILPFKYKYEIHANEIVLLAYYIAAVNIENIFNVKGKTYVPFSGICFTDTFQTFEDDDRDALFQDRFQKNSERIKNQIDTEIQIIIGNPPYSVGQRSANDNAQNNYYPKIEQKISATYAANTKATNKNSLYDSYIKAFRWASDRIGESGVIGFVTNAGWLDGAAMDGMRKCFVKEFSEVYVFNLRGNARTQGELRRREKDNVFGQGSRAPIAITILVKNPAHIGDAKIFYLDIGDYLNRAQKLKKISAIKSVLSDEFKILTPNDKGDWINQRGDEFENFIPLTPDKKFNAAAQSFFVVNSRGFETGRDAWVYNFSRTELEKNILTTIDFYNAHTPLDVDATKIVWTSSTVANKNRHEEFIFNADKIFDGMYRPFCKEKIYCGNGLIHRRGQFPQFFPTGNEENLLICVSGIGGEKNLSVFITNKIIDLNALHSGTQCFPLYWYETAAQGNLFGEDYTRRDGVTDFILSQVKELSSQWSVVSGQKNSSSSLNTDNCPLITKEDIFYYVYGFLHLPSYREKFSAELKKSLPRIFLVDEYEKFKKISTAGRELAEIHLNYEKFDAPAEVEVIIEKNNFYVKKMRFAKDDRTTLIYNDFITIKNIPPRSFEYVVNGRSPLEWIVERYQVKVDSASGIENNPNDWCAEHGDEKYILNLILSCITVSLKTLDIVDSLPTVEF